jgi:DNA-binding NtrC family response regulator
MDGVEVLDEINKLTNIPVIMISGHGDIETAVSCIKNGAFDFIQKPIDLSRLLVSVKNALDKNNLVKETKILKKKVSDKYEMIGESPAILEIQEIIEKVAPSDAKVLITGENGTGKELVAHWLHQKSERSHAPLIEVNCAAIPAELIESQLFGHEKGSFTSAHKKKIGDFELANGGSLFLDEIGDMSLSAQSKVLRALQENKITRVGGEKEINVDVRIIAATNKDLKEEIKKGEFREDLFHRLSVIPIHVPALRERKEDIPILVNHFVKVISEKQGSKAPVFEDDAIEKLQNMKWTGNIRELRNVVERLMILCSKSVSSKDIDKYVNPIMD